MNLKSVPLFGEPRSIVLVCIFLLATGYLLNLWLKPRNRLDLPLLGKTDDHKHDFQALVEEGARKYPNAPYKIKSGGIEMVVYPATIWNEVKRLPDTLASAQDFFYASIHGSWTHVGTESDSLWKVVAIDLARSIPAKVREKQQHCGRAFDKTIGPCPEWKEVELFSAIMRAIAQTNACTFVGDELGTSEQWIRSVERYPMAVMIACFALNAFPAFLRPVLSPLFFIPTVYVQWDAKRMLASVIKKNMEEYQNASDQKEYLRTKEDRQVPFTAWLMSRHKPGKATAHQLYVDILLASFESTASSASTLYNTVADLAAHPEYIEILREELESVMMDGKLPMTNLNELKKMDSVMRESFRMTPFGLFSLNRVARAPLKLSIGPELPAGTTFCVDSHHINASPILWSSPPATQWDGLRFYKLRQDPSNANRHQFVTTGPDAPNWGDGTQACPGRFFATSAIKIALAHLILKYDFRLREGEGRPKKVSMPNGSWAPDVKARILFRSRE